MRICLTVNAAWNVWNFRRPLVRALLDAGHEVHVLAPRDDSAPKLVAMGCTFTHLPMSRKGLNPVTEIGLVLRFVAAFRRIRPDIACGFTAKNNIFGSLAAAILHIPFLPNVTGLGTAFLSGGILRKVAVALHRAAFRTCPIVFFQNDDDRDLFVAEGIVRSDQARVLPGSGIDLDAFPSSAVPQSPATAFLFIGRLIRDKGIVEFVEAARLVRARYPATLFRVLGSVDIDNRTAIEAATVAEWVADGLIEHLGQTDDVRPHIAAADCVVLPSYREGAPRTLIEAAAMGRPTIATDVPGCRSVVDDEVTGLLCEVRSAASLADRMIRFCEFDQDERQAMGDAARQRMERRFSAALIVEAYGHALTALSPHAGDRR